MNSLYLNHQAHIWVGDQTTLHNKVDQFLIESLCPKKGCFSCSTCSGIRMRQHHSIFWMEPESQKYTLDQFKPLVQMTSFTLEPDEKKFIIIAQADVLGSSCGNSLLKTIEEPPHGFYFILLTHRLDDILITIRSRCIITQYSTTTVSERYQTLIDQFIHLDKRDAITFGEILESSTPLDHETRDLLDELYVHWKKKYLQSLSKQKSKSLQLHQTMLTIITDAMKMPPMNGSSKLFWKDFYIRSSL